MNIHSLNDFERNNNNDSNNDNIHNNQLFLSEANPNDSEQFQFRDKYFPKQIYKIKSASFFLIFILVITYIIQIILYYNIYEPKGYNWGCLLFNFGALEISSIANHYNYFRIITSILAHNNFGHLLLDILSIAFIGCYVEFELKNIYNFLLLFLISGIIGTFSSLLFSYKNISMGSSGAILGLCGYYILNFIFNLNKIFIN
jgi:membrane associated rhomboid family serine protease